MKLDLSNLNVLVDLETLSLRKDAVILSIGAVAFTKDGITDQFYINIDPKSCEKHGLRTDAGTAEWWTNTALKSPDTYKALLHRRVSLPCALELFDVWYQGFQFYPSGIWGNSPSFDLDIFANAFNVVGREKPWSFGYERDFRTIRNLASSKPDVQNADWHNALADARYEAEMLIEIFRQLNGTAAQ